MTAESALPIAKVRSSFARCCGHDDFIDTFYHCLVSEAPQTAPMFAETDMVTQDTLVRAGINHLIDCADGVVGIASKIREIGTKHDRDHLNVQPELYERWVDALVQAVTQCDDQFDSHVEEAWRAVLRPGIDLMASVY
jgi:hemoglobin-like flavoprotein